jgi:hypothetical protein
MYFEEIKEGYVKVMVPMLVPVHLLKTVQSEQQEQPPATPPNLLQEFENGNDEIFDRIQEAILSSQKVRVEKETDIADELSSVMDDMEGVSLTPTAPSVLARPYNFLSTSQQIELEKRLLQKARNTLSRLFPNAQLSGEDFKKKLNEECERLFNDWEELCIHRRKVELP